jgi:hypothetical protein
MHPLGTVCTGVDVVPLRKADAPVLGSKIGLQRYFSYHYAAYDTYDKVNRELHPREQPWPPWQTW